MIHIIKLTITSGMGPLERVIPIVNILGFKYLNLLRERVIIIENLEELYTHELFLVYKRLIDIKSNIDSREYEIVTGYTFGELESVIKMLSTRLEKHCLKS